MTTLPKACDSKTHCLNQTRGVHWWHSVGQQLTKRLTFLIFWKNWKPGSREPIGQLELKKTVSLGVGKMSQNQGRSPDSLINLIGLPWTEWLGIYTDIQSKHWIFCKQLADHPISRDDDCGISHIPLLCKAITAKDGDQSSHSMCTNSGSVPQNVKMHKEIPPHLANVLALSFTL